jgi:hypothetical protein
VLFALVANRAIDPGSKLAASEWASLDVAIPGLAVMDEDQAYRAMDLLVDDATRAKVQEGVFFAVATLLNLEVDFLLFDTTSTYWERDTEDTEDTEATEATEATGDAAGAGGRNVNADSMVGEDPSRGAGGGFRRFGHSKDHRNDLPQIVIGLAVTKEGIPVRCCAGRGTPPT